MTERIDIYIKRLKPLDITEADYQKLGLVELVALGYGYQGTDEHLSEQTLTEYDGIDKEHRIDIFMAIHDGKAIGSLTTVNWSPLEPIRGQYFWDNLSKVDLLLCERAYIYSSYAFEIIGIVTHPDYRKRKVASTLLHEAAAILKPAFILGQTKAPAAVTAIANALSSLGYRTFFGDFEVTPSQNRELPFSPSNLTNAHLAVRSHKLDEYGLLYVDTDMLLPTIPDVSEFPSCIQAAFGNVIDSQKRIGNIKTAVKPLLSVHREVI